MIPYGPYFLIKRLAVGGMGEVFLARDADQLVVVKRILPHLQTRSDFLEMFLDEARLSLQLSHRNLVRVHDHGEAAGVNYIAMEYVDGMTLSGIMRRLGGESLPLDLCCWIVAEACAGLAHAHELADDAGEPLGIVHRDISPDNILLSRRGEVKLADFGVAKASRQQTQTRPGQVKGKYSYMSPEQGMRLVVDHRSDIFSVGVVLYRLVTGQRVFKAPNEVGILRALYQREYTPPDRIRSDLPLSLVKLINRALSWEPDGRFADASQMREALLAAVPSRGDLSGAVGELVQRLCAVPAASRPVVEEQTHEMEEAGAGDRDTLLGVGAAGEQATRGITLQIPELSGVTERDMEAADELSWEDAYDTLREYPAAVLLASAVAAHDPAARGEARDGDSLQGTSPVRALDSPLPVGEPGGAASDGQPSGSAARSSMADPTARVSLAARPDHPADALSDSGFHPVAGQRKTYEILFDQDQMKDIVKSPNLRLIAVVALSAIVLVFGVVLLSVLLG